MGNPIGKENVMMAESPSDGELYHSYDALLFIVINMH